MNAILAQIKQPSTIRGLAILAGLIGIKLSPDMTDAIAASVVAVLGLVEVIRNERKP